MSELQTVSITIGILTACISVVIGVVNQILSNRRAEEQRQREIETRQIDNFMQTVGRLDLLDFIEVVYQHQWTDVNDWRNKYGVETNPQAFASLVRLLRYYNQIGALVKRNIVDIGLISEQIGVMPLLTWEKLEPIIQSWRIELNPRSQEPFEFLVNELKNYEHQQQATPST